MKVNEILSESNQPVPRLESFLFHHPALQPLLKQEEFYDLEDLEDLFDYAYLDGCSVHDIALGLSDNGKAVTVAQAEREALSKAKFAIDNMDDKKTWKKALTPLAAEWAKKIAPEIKATVDDYLE